MTSAGPPFPGITYDELHALAERALRGQRPRQTLQATDLIHEVWLRLAATVEQRGLTHGHVLALFARTARRTLIDHARKRHSDRRGSDDRRVTLSGLPGAEQRALDLLDLDAALDELARLSERRAQVVELHWMTGLDFEGVARALSISSRTAKADWRFARAWLLNRLDSGN